MGGVLEESDDDDEWSSPVKLPFVKREESPHFGFAARTMAAAGTPGSRDGDEHSWTQLNELPTL
eukprot:5735026-Prorocentrum_lima.AAC.1